MFSGLQRDELLKFAELTRERTYPKGSVILFQGDPGDSLYVLRQGRAKVVLFHRKDYDDVLYVQVYGAIATPGSVDARSCLEWNGRSATGMLARLKGQVR